MCEAAHIHPSMHLDITSRINGSEGKIGILKAAQASLGVYTPSLIEALNNTWGAFQEHKRYRDGVIHAVVFNTSDPIAETTQRQGKKDEVLITAEALNALYDRVNLLAKEISSVSGMFAARQSWWRDRWDKSLADARKKHQRDFRRYRAQYLRFQKKRLSQPPLPQFPVVSEPTLKEIHLYLLKAFGFPEDAASLMAQSMAEGIEKDERKERQRAESRRKAKAKRAEGQPSNPRHKSGKDQG